MSISVRTMSTDLIQKIEIASDLDVASSRKIVREECQRFGFGITDITRIVTAASELSRNILLYAGRGTLELNKIELNGKTGIELIFEDEGPGIKEFEKSMENGFENFNGLGLGLRGAKRLMDDMEIQSEVGIGTKITVKKWL